MKTIIYSILLTLIFSSSTLLAKPSTEVQQVIVWNQLLTHPNSMVPELLNKVFQVTAEEYGPFQLIPSEPMELSHAIEQMESQGRLDIALFAPNKKRQSNAIAVPVPVTGTLLSYRICLIQKGQQQKFKDIKDLDGLIDSEVLIGQHQTWSDTNILQSNGLALHTTYNYSQLFEQLTDKHFDCFSRGANEVLQEYYAHGYKGIDIEKSLVIHYPLPLYYFANNGKPELAQRIEKGMNTLIKNGEYKRMFSHNFSNTVKLLNLPKRTILELNNPLMTDQAREQMMRDSYYYKDLIQQAYLAK